MEYTYVLSMGCWQNPVSENQSVKKKIKALFEPKWKYNFCKMIIMLATKEIFIMA